MLEIDNNSSDDIALVRDAARRWFAESYLQNDEGFSRDAWNEMAALGWHGVAVSEEKGGLGLPFEASLVLAGEVGRALAIEPFAEASALVLGMLSSLSSTSETDRLIGEAIDGEGLVVPVAFDRPVSVSGGVARRVCCAQGVTGYLVAAQEGNQLGIFLLPADAEGIQRRAYRSVDGRPLCDLVIPDLTGAAFKIASGNEAAGAMATASGRYAALLVAEAVGAMEATNAITRNYLGERKQFGAPLASFQALGHTIADMHADCEMAASFSAVLLTPGGEQTSPALTLQAKAYVSTACRTIAERAIQLHGGMGMTQEMAVGRFAKRLLYLSTALGGETAPRQMIAKAIFEEIRQLQNGKDAA